MLDREFQRRELLAATAGLTASLAGCSEIAGQTSNETPTPPENPPQPKILDASADIGNFRQTQSRSDVLFIVKNNGGLGEVQVSVKARGDVAVYAEDQSKFSLREGQEHQVGFELFTHEGANQVEIHAKSTAVPENSDEVVLSPEQTPDKINYESNQNENSN